MGYSRVGWKVSVLVSKREGGGGMWTRWVRDELLYGLKRRA